MEKYKIIGSPSQVAAIDFGSSISKARKCCALAEFSNGMPALVVGSYRLKRDAELFLKRCECALAFKSRRINKWITPTFTIIKP